MVINIYYPETGTVREWPGLTQRNVNDIINDLSDMNQAIEEAGEAPVHVIIKVWREPCD